MFYFVTLMKNTFVIPPKPQAKPPIVLYIYMHKCMFTYINKYISNDFQVIAHIKSNAQHCDIPNNHDADATHIVS